ncbi:hypothetical protein [Streptomyces sp. NPDC002690]
MLDDLPRLGASEQVLTGASQKFMNILTGGDERPSEEKIKVRFVEEPDFLRVTHKYAMRL